MSGRRVRRTFTAEDKVSIVHKHLLEQVPLTELCEEYDIKPNQYYTWQKQFFERGVAAFSSDQDQEKKSLQKENNDLKEKLAKKDEIIAEVAEAFVSLKKELGET